MEQVVVGGMLTPRSKLKIGKRVKVFPYSFLNPTENILIEDDVGIGGANYIFTHGSWQSILDGFPVKFGPVTIKRGAWFPWRVFVMPGITVGEYATIGAGSTITKDIPPRSLAVGVPAKVIKQESEYIKKLDDNAKDKIMLNIMNEFTDYLNYIDYMATLHKEDRFTFIKVKKKHITNTISYKYKYNVLPASDIFISLSKFDESLITQLINANKIWFDIERRQCCYSSDSLWLETMNFLSRYGIRFNVFDK
ncbi:MAG TPA: acyltransferase [Thermoplasmata archaeon]|nr:acyltransferase [Thermoplasmata archaeon]